MSSMALIKIPPFYYAHILDTNTNIARMVSGPLTLLVKESEKIIVNPTKMHTIQSSEYCIIESPVLLDDEKKIIIDKHGQVKLKHGQREVRFEQSEPFPLYPGEFMVGKISPLQVVLNNEALVIKALVDFIDTETNKLISAGDEWLFQGPATYKPRVEEQVKELRNATIVKAHCGLKLEAINDFTDKVYGKKRKSGDEWLMTVEGPYILDAYERLKEVVMPYVLNDNKAIIVKATRKFTDDDGIERKKGDTWLITKSDTPLYLPQPTVKVEKEVNITSLTALQYTIIDNPWDEETQSNKLGERKIVKGPKNFFTFPGESYTTVHNVMVLEAEDAVHVKVMENFEETIVVPGENNNNTIKTIQRKSGTKYDVFGPREYIPPLTVEVIKRKKAIFKLEDFNIYIFNISFVYVLSIILFFYFFIKLFF
ncbi:hypothetical protein DICPUDRAFT_95079 [Dictyostelium purpureum]|uniref:Major vault protein n=1 Tax=Dictyostelium purpureum TaxID=5786 RepID=F0ZS14_DICPU|nr:uncharacterized protein DICPUDRAFT_95079 [Dictyostelium purpureum]EGC33256.1 hypothetical protein DICPUDRAFT_95079 [Dictyostelium purpureum]|eukprot:XP_003290203.1 hypothetical protein DICPUDRAFT_95079 [Dictyostelium purpureum]